MATPTLLSSELRASETGLRRRPNVIEGVNAGLHRFSSTIRPYNWNDMNPKPDFMAEPWTLARVPAGFRFAFVSLRIFQDNSDAVALAFSLYDTLGHSLGVVNVSPISGGSPAIVQVAPPGQIEVYQPLALQTEIRAQFQSGINDASWNGPNTQLMLDFYYSAA